MRARRLLGWSVAVLAAVAVVEAAVAQPTALAEPASREEVLAGLDELPVPDLRFEEAGIRSQMERSREVLDGLLASPAATLDQLAEAFGRLGRLYFVYDLNDVAPIALRNAIRLQPQNYRWRYYLAAHQAFEGAFEEAEEQLRRVLELERNDLGAHLRLGDLLLDRGAEDEAESFYRRALELDAQNPAALAGLGRLALKRKDFQRAIDLIAKALELQPEADSLYHTLGMAYRGLGDLDQARDALAKNRQGRVKFRDPLIEALALENLSAEAHFQAGSEAMRRGDMKGAAAFFRSYVQIKPDDEVAHHNLGIALLTTDTWDEGIRELRRAIELKPDYLGGHFSLGSALIEDGNLEEGLEHYRRAHELDPADRFVHADYATLLAKVGRYDEALAELRGILEADPDQDYARLKYGVVLAVSGRTDDARKVLEAISQAPSLIDKHRAEAYYHLGVIDNDAGNVEGALATWRHALELDPRSYEAASALARTLARSRRFAEAADAFDRAVELEPADDPTHFSRAMASILGGDYPRARTALESSLETRPESLELRHALARLLATCPDAAVRDAAKALELAQAVMSARPSVDHAETLAMAFAESGLFERAVNLQRQVLEQTKLGGRASEQERRVREQRLELYLRGEPVREPWSSGR